MKKLSLVLASVLCVILLTLKVTGQSESPAAGSESPATDVEPTSTAMQFVALPPPATQLEALAAAKERVIIKGYAKIGELNGDDGSIIRISAVEMTDANSGEKK